MLTFNLCSFDGCWIAYPEDDCDTPYEILSMLRDKRKLVINSRYEKVFREALAALRSECKTDLKLEVVDDED